MTQGFADLEEDGPAARNVEDDGELTGQVG